MLKPLIAICINPWCSEHMRVANYDDMRCPCCGSEIHVFNNLKNGNIDLVEFTDRFKTDQVDYVKLIYNLDAVYELLY